MRPKSLALILLTASVCLTLYLISWCFVSYASSMSRAEIQSIYNVRILSLGSIITLIQLAAMIAVLVDAGSSPDKKN